MQRFPKYERIAALVILVLVTSCSQVVHSIVNDTLYGEYWVEITNSSNRQITVEYALSTSTEERTVIGRIEKGESKSESLDGPAMNYTYYFIETIPNQTKNDTIIKIPSSGDNTIFTIYSMGINATNSTNKD